MPNPDNQFPPIPLGLTKAEWNYHIVESSPGDGPGSYMNLWYKELWDDYHDINNQTPIGIVIRSNIQKRYAREHTQIAPIVTEPPLKSPTVTHQYNMIKEARKEENGMDVTVTKHEMAISAFGRKPPV